MSMELPIGQQDQKGFMTGYLEALALVERLHRLLLDDNAVPDNSFLSEQPPPVHPGTRAGRPSSPPNMLPFLHAHL